MNDTPKLKSVIQYNRYDAIKYLVRSAQAVLQYGVGAMVDFSDQTLMVAAPEYWVNLEDNLIRIYDERLQKALDVDYFGLPQGIEQSLQSGISYVRFPQWYFCPKCRRFQPMKEWIKEYRIKSSTQQLQKDPYMKSPHCSTCNINLVPARLVTVCKHGHIDDFPWIEWVHKGRENVCSNPRLTITSNPGATAGLESIRITCESCNTSTTLIDALDPEIFSRLDEHRDIKKFQCTGNEPWKHSKVECDEYPRAVLRGASSVYFPKTVSSLVIPPFSDIVCRKVEKSTNFKKCQDYLQMLLENDNTIEKIREKNLTKWANTIANEIFVDYTLVEMVLERKLFNSGDEDDISVESAKYKAEEFEVLAGDISSANEEITRQNDFQMEHVDAVEYKIPGVKSISLIHKMREVRALVGFKRLSPPDSSDGEKDPDFVCVKEQNTRWYPAYEVRGEGIFLEFDIPSIHHWINNNPIIQQRGNRIDSNYAHTLAGESNERNITPRFIFLHTLAHLLIRELSFECGYSVASLRERIYCATQEEGKEMAGILIYTASGDSEGTMGGLVRQGLPDTLPNIFKRAIRKSMICSNDPVCISNEEGQGRDGLNLAACHACVLLPETSCEEFNVFLDRAMIVGTFEHREIGFYNDWLTQ